MQKEYPKITFIHVNWYFGKLMLYTGVAFIVTNLLISYNCTQNPYEWTKLDNILFFCLTRLSYGVGWLLLAFYIILGHTNIGQMILASPPFLALGKLVYCIYLIFPIIMMIVYSSTVKGVFMSLIGNIYLGMGNMMVAFIVAGAVYAII